MTLPSLDGHRNHRVYKIGEEAFQIVDGRWERVFGFDSEGDTRNGWLDELLAPASHRVCLDLDDAYPGNDRIEILEALRAQIPRFRVTLFAIPGRCTPGWVAEMQARPWVDIVPHGWMHLTNRECERWDPMQCSDALEAADRMGFTSCGFKAPGWQISPACYEVLGQYGYWVMDQPYNNHRRPPELPVYLLGAPPAGITQIHGHVGHLNGHNANELEYLVPEILKYRDAEFVFARDCAATRIETRPA